jgi:pimeloyl-ACP methyl ester carboxylesterase
MYERIGRRGFLKSAAASAAAFSLAACSRPSGGDEELLSPDEVSKSGDTISNRVIFDDETYYFELLRTLGHTYFGGADINECFATAHRIKEGDDEGWYEQWIETARRVMAVGEKSEKGGHPISAGEAYLRASNYFRTAEFFLHADQSDTRAYEAWKMSRDCFVKSIPYLPFSTRAVEIPFEGTTLPGYFIRGEGGPKRAPLVIVHSGFDGTSEEESMGNGFAAAKRGYNCLVIDGPGQGRVIREQNIPFRPNWETVITPVVDYAVKLPEVDPRRIVLMGISLGGMLAPRACAFEHRIHTCVANSGLFSFYDPVAGEVPERVMKKKRENPKAFEAALKVMMAVNAEARWFVNDGMWKFGADSPTELFIKIEDYTLKGVTDKIRCNMLICDGEEEHFFEGQAKKLYDLLKCPKDFMVFTVEEAAASHCQSGAEAVSSQRVFDWLDDNVMKG